MRKGVPQRYRVESKGLVWSVYDSQDDDKVIASFPLRREAREYAQQRNEQVSSGSGADGALQLQND